MPSTGDQLYKDYVRRNMARFATKVKVREILPHLSSLTQSDREEVEAKREMTGNYNAMQLLLNNLKRRENWPEEFIRALEECEHPALAQEMRDAYEALKSTGNVKTEGAGMAGSPGAMMTAHVPPPPPAVSVPDQPAVPTSSAEAAAAEPFESAPVPSSPAKSSLYPSGTSEPPSPAKAAPDTLVSSTSQPAPPPDVVPKAESPPLSPAAPAPKSTPSTGAEIPEVPQTEEAQALDVRVPSEPDIPDGPTHTHVPPTEVTESPGLSPDQQSPNKETTPVSPELTKAPIQETSSLSCRVNPLLQEPEETSDPTMHQISTDQQLAAPPEDKDVQPPPPEDEDVQPPPPEDEDVQPPPPEDKDVQPPPSDMQNITLPAPAPVPVPVFAIVHQPPPSLVGRDVEEEESLTKPEVLHSVTVGSSTSQEPVTETRPPCSVTLGDQEISTPADNVVCEANSEVSPRANTDECPEPVPQPETVPSVTEANHTQEAVTVKENGSPSYQPNGLLDGRAPSPHHAPTEQHSESLCSSSLGSQEQSTLVHVVHVVQGSSIQNEDGQAQSLMGDVVSSEDTAMVNHSDTQIEASLTEPTTNHHNLSPSTVGNEVHMSPVKEEASATEDTSCAKTEVILQANEREAQEEENKYQENGTSNEEEQSQSPLAGLLPALQNTSLIPAAAAIGVCALVFAWKLRN